MGIFPMAVRRRSGYHGAMAHVVLLGDSIFDNRAYSQPEPDVVTHLSELLDAPAADGRPWRASLLAVDGAVTADVHSQIARIPDDASHLVLSCGGNDALAHQHLLVAEVGSVHEALARLTDPLERFSSDYRSLLRELRAVHLPLTVCTIYNGNLGPPEAVSARVAVSLFNDIIQRVARAAHARVIELRAVCTEPSDYANPIEPSGAGGRKIADAIARSVGAR